MALGKRQKQKKPTNSRPLLLTVMVLLLFLCMAEEPVAGDKRHSAVNCRIQTGPCTREIADRKVTLEIFPRPVEAMRDLTLKIAIEGGYADQQPYIDLNMPAMNMGPNRVFLKPDGRGAFEGRGVIVRCRSGNTTWRATVSFPGIGSADFIFDVVY